MQCLHNVRTWLPSQVDIDIDVAAGADTTTSQHDWGHPHVGFALELAAQLCRAAGKAMCGEEPLHSSVHAETVAPGEAGVVTALWAAALGLYRHFGTAELCRSALATSVFLSQKSVPEARSTGDDGRAQARRSVACACVLTATAHLWPELLYTGDDAASLCVCVAVARYAERARGGGARPQRSAARADYEGATGTGLDQVESEWWDCATRVLASRCGWDLVRTTTSEAALRAAKAELAKLDKRVRCSDDACVGESADLRHLLKLCGERAVENAAVSIEDGANCGADAAPGASDAR